MWVLAYIFKIEIFRHKNVIDVGTDVNNNTTIHDLSMNFMSAYFCA